MIYITGFTFVVEAPKIKSSSIAEQKALSKLSTKTKTDDSFKINHSYTLNGIVRMADSNKTVFAYLFRDNTEDKQIVMSFNSTYEGDDFIAELTNQKEALTQKRNKTNID